MGSVLQVLGVNQPIVLEGNESLPMVRLSAVLLFMSLNQEPSQIGQKPPLFSKQLSDVFMVIYHVRHRK